MIFFITRHPRDSQNGIQLHESNLIFYTLKKSGSAVPSDLGGTWLNLPNFLHSDLRAKFKKILFFHQNYPPMTTSNLEGETLRAFKG